MKHMSLTLLVGLVHLVNVDPAPAPLSDSRISLAAIPDLANRFMLEDKRQNWGILVNESIYSADEDVSYDRPINIPRYPISSPVESEQVEIIATKQRSPQPRRILQNSSEVNNAFKVSSNKPKQIFSHCDRARLRCCMNKADVDNCFNATKCLKLDNFTDLCNAKAMHETIKRALNLFDAL